jgi:hypothetical protein
MTYIGVATFRHPWPLGRGSSETSTFSGSSLRYARKDDERVVFQRCWTRDAIGSLAETMEWSKPLTPTLSRKGRGGRLLRIISLSPCGRGSG